MIDFAATTSHVKVESSPAFMEAGPALKVVMMGIFEEVTVSSADAVELPASLEAVSRYLVVEPGETFCVPVNGTGPISGLIETDVASATLHDNIAD